MKKIPGTTTHGFIDDLPEIEKLRAEERNNLYHLGLSYDALRFTEPDGPGYWAEPVPVAEARLAATRAKIAALEAEEIKFKIEQGASRFLDAVFAAQKNIVSDELLDEMIDDPTLVSNPADSGVEADIKDALRELRERREAEREAK